MLMSIHCLRTSLYLSDPRVLPSELATVGTEQGESDSHQCWLCSQALGRRYEPLFTFPPWKPLQLD